MTLRKGIDRIEAGRGDGAGQGTPLAVSKLGRAGVILWREGGETEAAFRARAHAVTDAAPQVGFAGAAVMPLCVRYGTALRWRPSHIERCRDDPLRFRHAGVLATPAHAVECWTASNFRGQSAQADEGYSFTPDSFADGMLICLSTEGGMVSGNDLDLVRLGDSTLMGWAINGLGLEVVNVYQIDRARGVLLFTQSRIGTATVTSLFPDYAAVFVADLERVRQRRPRNHPAAFHRDQAPSGFAGMMWGSPGRAEFM